MGGRLKRSRDDDDERAGDVKVFIIMIEYTKCSETGSVFKSINVGI